MEISNKIKNLVKNQKFSFGGNKYQDFHLGDEYIVGRRITQIRMQQFNFPQNMDTIKLLDLGCNYGCLCIEAKKRNARLVVGVDILRSNITIARELSKYSNLDIKFLQANICEETFFRKLSKISQTFDYVLALSLLPHVSEKCLANVLNRINSKYIFFEAHLGKRWKDWKTIYKFIKINKLHVKVVKFFGRSTDDTKHRLLWLLKKE